MNFCQSHLNHHCVHAHNCTNKEHQKLNKKHQNKKQSLQRIKSSQQSMNKSHKEKCQFRNNTKIDDQSEEIKRIFKILEEKQLQLKEIKAKNNQLEGKLAKEISQSKNFQSQIQYYRQQFTKLIQNNSIDTKNQIKKRITETGDFALKVRSLETKNESLKIEISELKKSLSSKEHYLQKLKRQNDQFQQKNQLLRSKLKDLDLQKSELKEAQELRFRETSKNEEKSKILISQLKQRCQNMQREKHAMSAELDSLKQQKNIFEKKYRNQSEIRHLQGQSIAKQNQRLVLQLNEKQKTNRDLLQKLKEMNEKTILLEQDLKHTKNCFQFTKAEANRNQQQPQRTQPAFLTDKKTLGKQAQEKSGNKQNIFESGNQHLLRKEIAELKTIIKQLQQKSMVNVQEVILKIGASEAFKRLIDQKNEIIKKLMREKAQIKANAILSHHD